MKSRVRGCGFYQQQLEDSLTFGHTITRTKIQQLFIHHRPVEINRYGGWKGACTKACFVEQGTG